MAPAQAGPAASDSPGDAGPLRRCVAVDEAEFAARYWGRAPLLTRADDFATAGRPPGFADLLDLDGVDDLLSRRGLRTPFLRVAKDGRLLPAAAVHRRRRARRGDRRPGPRRTGAGALRRRGDAGPAGPAPHLAAAGRLRRPARRRAGLPGAGQRLPDAGRQPGLRHPLRHPRRVRAPGRRPQAVASTPACAHRSARAATVGRAGGRGRGATADGAGRAGRGSGARRRAVPAARLAARRPGAGRAVAAPDPGAAPPHPATTWSRRCSSSPPRSRRCGPGCPMGPTSPTPISSVRTWRPPSRRCAPGYPPSTRNGSPTGCAPGSGRPGDPARSAPSRRRRHWPPWTATRWSRYGPACAGGSSPAPRSGSSSPCPTARSTCPSSAPPRCARCSAARRYACATCRASTRPTPWCSSPAAARGGRHAGGLTTRPRQQSRHAPSVTTDQGSRVVTPQA